MRKISGSTLPQQQQNPHRALVEGGEHHQPGRPARAPNDSAAVNRKGIVTSGRDRSQMVLFSSAAHEKGFTSHNEVVEAHRALERVHYAHSLSNQVLQFRRQGATDEQKYTEVKTALEFSQDAAPRRHAGWALTLNEQHLAPATFDGSDSRKPRRSPHTNKREGSVERPTAKALSSPRLENGGSPRLDGNQASAQAAPRNGTVRSPVSRKRPRSGGALASISNAYGSSP